MSSPSRPNAGQSCGRSPSSLTTRGGRSRRTHDFDSDNSSGCSGGVRLVSMLRLISGWVPARRERTRVSGRDGPADPGPRISISIHPSYSKGTKIVRTRCAHLSVPGSGDRLRPRVVRGWRPCGAGAPPTASRRSRFKSSASCRR